MSARARVLCVLAAARAIADRESPLGREARARLPDASGLSPEGVELALGEHLEQGASNAELRALLGWARAAPRCHVVLSANVCTAAVRAIVLAAATAPDVTVKPSRRDPVVAELVVRALGEDPAFRDAGGAVRIAPDVAPSDTDELHVYGRDETVDAFRARWPSARLRSHGHGFGIAAVGAGASLEDAASKLARDVVPFDQRGCLSPRVALVEGDAATAHAFASALDERLSEMERRVPRGRVDAEDAAALASYERTLEAVGELRRGATHRVGVDPSPRALLLPPPVRAVHVVPVSVDSLPPLLSPLSAHVAAVGTSEVGRALRQALRDLVPRARWSALGEMQRPPLDGPVDRR